MSYRREWPSSTWHWRTNCASWPKEMTLEERDERPDSGSFCAECEKLDLQARFNVLAADDSAVAALRALQAGRLYG